MILMHTRKTNNIPRHRLKRRTNEIMSNESARRSRKNSKKFKKTETA